VYQALLTGTPILGVPFHVDQELNLQRVEDLKFGCKLSPKRLTPEILMDTLEGLLAGGEYKKNAMRLKAAAEAYGGARQAAGYILDYLKGP
ncbi:glycosyltransferase, partial [Thermodesulfobacteriota bacterium]